MPDANRLRDLWTGLGGKGQFTLLFSAIAVLGTGYLLFNYANKPSYATVASNLASNDAALVAKALESSGIAYKLSNGGSTVAVQTSQLSDARLALSKEGLPKGGHVGFELFDRKSLGQTEFQQKVDYQRALEGEISRTIEDISGVDSADVQLVLPEDSLFVGEAAKASAAVLVGGQLDPDTIRGIAHLVSSSVKGLNTQDVTITSTDGTLLWPSSDSGPLSAASQLQAEQLYSNQLSGQINAMLAATLGPQKAQARVHADLSLDQRQVDKVSYGKNGIPLSSQADTETLGAVGQAPVTPAGTSLPISTPGATAGTTTTTPTTTAPTTTTSTTTTPTTTTSTTTTPTSSTSYTAGTTPSSNYEHKTSQTTYGVDKTIERTTIAPGTVNKLDVALLVDQSVPAAQVNALKSAVASMAGIDPKRGDTLSVSKVKFATPAATPAAKTGPLASLNMIGLAKDAALGLGGVIFLFLIRRSLKKREKQHTAPEPTWLREVEAEWPIRELDAPTMRLELEPGTGSRRAQVRDELEDIARSQPEKVALQVSQWVRE